MLWSAFLEIFSLPSVAGTSWGGHPPGLCFSSSLYTTFGVDQMPQGALALVLGPITSRKVGQDQGSPTGLHNIGLKGLHGFGGTRKAGTC